ncbi:MAG: prolipoprotein diacylglyceryl transferase [Ignavibacteriales bacterium]|nr:prolipoprotein diacylglyceryl transferase [Ignavibacteriales bacterium]
MIVWDVSPEILTIGPITIRWYGVLYASAFLIGIKILQWIFKKESKSSDDLNSLVLHLILGTIIGARLGHCLFYSPEYYLSNPIEIIKIWEGGLASHGGVIGIALAIYLYQRKRKGQSLFWVCDRAAIPIALAAMFIRIGNLFNSEIIGKPADLPWSFVFVRDDNIPRHPAQLYEAFSYLIIFVLLLIIYKKYYKTMKDGLITGILFISVFAARFIIEFFKENQSPFESNLPINMGQILSIPLIIIGIVILIVIYKKRKVIKIE